MSIPDGVIHPRVRRRRILPPLLAFGALACGGGTAAAAAPPPAGEEDRLIVVFDRGAAPAERVDARADAGATAVRALGRPDFQLLDVRDGRSVAQAIAELRDDPSVLAVERDRAVRPAAIPDDPLFPDLWALRNTGQSVAGRPPGTPDADIDAPLAWDRTRGTPSTVAVVIDTGYRFDHPDLAPVAWTNPGETPGNGVDDDGNGYVDDWRGWDGIDDDKDPTARPDPLFGPDPHGAHVAGTVGARGNDGTGMTGVAQDVRIAPFRACAVTCDVSAVVEGMNYAGRIGARVANLSLGGGGSSPVVRAAMAANPTVLFVVAAGNSGVDNDLTPEAFCEDPTARAPGYRPPAGAVDNVVCVAASDQDDRLPSFSNFGRRSVDLAAPGTDILSADYTSNPVQDLNLLSEETFADWTTPVPPADDASQGFSWRAPTDESRGYVWTDPATHAPGVTRATRSPDVVLPPGAYASCSASYPLFAIMDGDDALTWEVLLDGEVVAGGTETGIDQFEGRTVGADVAVPPGEHTIASRFAFRRGEDGADAAEAQLFTGGITCESMRHEFRSGTSMAAPHVTGAAALLFSLRPSATVTQVRRALLEGVDRKRAFSGKVATGGRLNAWKALGVLVPMDTRITSGPSGRRNGSTATFAFDTGGTGDAGFQCSLDGRPFRACSSPQTYTRLSRGTHRFQVRSALKGGVDQTPATRVWSVGTR